MAAHDGILWVANLEKHNIGAKQILKFDMKAGSYLGALDSVLPDNAEAIMIMPADCSAFALTRYLVV